MFSKNLEDVLFLHIKKYKIINGVKDMYKKELDTSSGMWGLWNYDTYKHIDDYEKWDSLFCEDEDIAKQIENQSFVPIYIFEDGCRLFTIRIDEEISEREKKYILVQSEEYLLKSSGKVLVSGIDKIDKNIHSESVIELNIPEGYYSVKVYLIAWDDEPEAFLADGEINPEALSDFVVIIKSNANLEREYRTKINTFSEDD